MLTALLAKLQEADKSAVCQQVAWSFLIGYGSAVGFMFYPACTNFAAFISGLFHPQWWLTFFSAGMTGALSFTIGQKMKSLFDKPVPVTMLSSFSSPLTKS